MFQDTATKIQQLSDMVAPIKAENKEKAELLSSNLKLLKELNDKVYKKWQTSIPTDNGFINFAMSDSGQTFWVTETVTPDQGGFNLTNTKSACFVKLSKTSDEKSVTVIDINRMKQDEARPDQREEYQTTILLNKDLTLKEQQRINQMFTGWKSLLDPQEVIDNTK